MLLIKCDRLIVEYQPGSQEDMDDTYKLGSLEES